MLKREVAWQKLSGDVFRKPMFPVVFCALVGSGIQILVMIFLVFFYTLFQQYSPLNSQYTVNFVAFCFPVMGMLNGYTAARFYKFFNGTHWRELWGLSSGGVSGLYGLSFYIVWMAEMIEAKQFIFSETFIVIWFWIAVNFGFTSIGCYIGFKQQKL